MRRYGSLININPSEVRKEITLGQIRTSSRKVAFKRCSEQKGARKSRIEKTKVCLIQAHKSCIKTDFVERLGRSRGVDGNKRTVTTHSLSLL